MGPNFSSRKYLNNTPESKWAGVQGNMQVPWLGVSTHKSADYKTHQGNIIGK